MSGGAGGCAARPSRQGVSRRAAPSAPPSCAKNPPLRGPAPWARARARARRGPALRAALIALTLYGLLTLALFSNVVAHIGAAFPGDLGDPPSQAWIMAWDVHALTTPGAHLYRGNIFYPFHDVLAYQDSLLGALPLAAPALLLSGNPILAYNIVFLATFALCAWGAYLLAVTLVKDARAAFLAGLVYGFSPYRMVHLYHLNLLCGMWIPLALACWERVRRGDGRYWIGVGLCMALQALSAIYYAAFLAVALAVLLLPQLRRSPRAQRLALLRGAILTAVGCGAALAPFLAPYFRVEHLLGGSRGLGQAVYFAADLRDFLHTADLSVLYGWSGYALGVRPTDALQYLWPGATALALALYGRRAKGEGRRKEDQGKADRVRRWQAASTRRMPTGRVFHRPSPFALRPWSSYALLCAVAAVLCLGPFLKVWGRQTGIPLPYLLLYPLPGFAGLRDPARFGAIYTVALAVLAAYGAAALLRRVERRYEHTAVPTGSATVSAARAPRIPSTKLLAPLAMGPTFTGALVDHGGSCGCDRCHRAAHASISPIVSAVGLRLKSHGKRRRLKSLHGFNARSVHPDPLGPVPCHVLLRPGRPSWLVAALLCAGVLAESWVRPVPVAAMPIGAATPPVYRWLASHPSAPVLELPIGLENKTIWAWQAEMMLYAAYHWRPIVNGTGGFAPPGYVHAAAVYMSFPSAPTLRLLRARGVRYVVVHRAWLGARAADAIRARAARVSGVRLAGHWPDADVYELADISP